MERRRDDIDDGIFALENEQTTLQNERKTLDANIAASTASIEELQELRRGLQAASRTKDAKSSSAHP